MRFYIAASFSRQSAMKEIREVIQGLGHTVTSEWLDEPLGEAGLVESSADRDIRNVLDADIVIQESEPITGGKNVELGISIICGKQIWIVGLINNPFQWKASAFFDSWDEVFDLLKMLPISVDLSKEVEC